MYYIFDSNQLSNSDVTDFYLNIIQKAIEESGNSIKHFDFSRLPRDKKAIYIVPTILDAFKLYIKGYKKFITWHQGVLPEESYMKHGSKLRYSILSFLEKLMLRKAFKVFLVSQQMKTHFESKYKVNLDNKSFIMPCFNTILNEKSFYEPQKYDNETYVYLGSLAKWQCFDETIKLYKIIEQQSQNKTKLYVYTKDIKSAQEIIEYYKVLNYEIDYVERQKLPNHLKSIKYGFLIREDHIVNNVSTPTKMSTYLANGIIPILSNTISDFESEFSKRQHFIFLSNKYYHKNVDLSQILVEYKDIFNSYYSESNYIINIRRWLFGECNCDEKK